MDSNQNAFLNSMSPDELNKKLLDDAKNGYTESIPSLINAGANLSAKDLEGKTPLMLAAYYGQDNFIEKLTPYLTQLDLLATDRTQNTALIHAADRGHIKVVSQLIAISKNDLAMINAINKLKVTAFIIATTHEHTEIMGILMQAGADTSMENYQDKTALTIAIEYKLQSSVFRILSGMPFKTVKKIQGHSTLEYLTHSHKQVSSTLTCITQSIAGKSMEWDSLARTYEEFIKSYLQEELAHEKEAKKLKTQLEQSIQAAQCIKAVIGIQDEIVSLFWLSRRVSVFVDLKGPSQTILQFLFPTWYLHRANKDVKRLFTSFNATLATKKQPMLGFSHQAQCSMHPAKRRVIYREAVEDHRIPSSGLRPPSPTR